MIVHIKIHVVHQFLSVANGHDLVSTGARSDPYIESALPGFSRHGTNKKLDQKS